VARRDCELGGLAIPAGTNVSVSVAAANRDPARYPHPDRFDPTRTNMAHLTFGAGPHVCLGMPLVRMEPIVAINALLDQLPDLHLDSTAPYPSINGVAFRSPAALPVEFTLREMHLYCGANGAKMAPCLVCRSKMCRTTLIGSCGSALHAHTSRCRNTFGAV
jgi:hypothetical protein